MTGLNQRREQDTKRRILIVDDHPMTRMGMAQIISNEPDLTVCGQFSTALEALEAVGKTEPDLVVTDIAMPRKSGIELIKDLAAMYPDVPVLATSMHDESLYAERVLHAGGRGYIMKDASSDEVVAAIRCVLEGHIFVSQEISSRLLESFAGGRATAGKSPVDLLSDREFEVFQFIGAGMGTREISERLSLSFKTVEAHRSNIKTKLKLKSASQLNHYAICWAQTERNI